MKMIKNKSPGNEDKMQKNSTRLSIWEDLETPLVSSFKSTFDKDKLSHSQKHEVIKWIERRDQDKRYTQNVWPISFLNVD